MPIFGDVSHSLLLHAMTTVNKMQLFTHQTGLHPRPILAPQSVEGSYKQNITKSSMDLHVCLATTLGMKILHKSPTPIPIFI